MQVAYAPAAGQASSIRGPVLRSSPQSTGEEKPDAMPQLMRTFNAIAFKQKQGSNLLLLLFTKLDKFTCVQLEEFGKYLTNLVYLNVIRDY